MAKKRKYTHRKGRIIPVRHGSILDDLDHASSPYGGPYKTPRKKKILI